MSISAGTLFIRASFGVVAGMGHALRDLHTALLLSMLLDLRFVYDGIETVPAGVHDDNIREIGEHQKAHDWDAVFGLRDLYPTNAAVRNSYDETVRLTGNGRWSLFDHSDIVRMKKLVDDCRRCGRRVMFEVQENERLMYWQVVEWERAGLERPGVSASFRRDIRAAFDTTRKNYLGRRAAATRPRVALHIRNSGEWPDTEQDRLVQRESAADVATWLGVPVEIYSEGTEKDMASIQALYRDVPSCMYFNENTVETFVAMATSDILLCGGSSFVHTAGLLSPGLKLTWQEKLCDYEFGGATQAFALDDEWLLVRGRLRRDAFLNRFESATRSAPIFGDQGA